MNTTRTRKLAFDKEQKNLVIYKEQVQGMWERFSTANSNVAAGSRFH
jgi:hypothetical protein